MIAAFLFSTGGVAADAVAEIGNAFFGVFAGHFRLVVAGVARPLGQGGLVTGGTGVIALAVIHGEGVRAVIRRGAPGGGIVALRAGLTGEHAQVVDRLGVAGGTCGGRAFVGIVFVALDA